MMLLAETARREGLFDWLAAVAAKCAAGSPQRVFLLVFGVGTIVTAFLSNDVTAVVLTPAVAAAVKTAKNRPEPLGRSLCAISPRRSMHAASPRPAAGNGKRQRCATSYDGPHVPDRCRTAQARSMRDEAYIVASSSRSGLRNVEDGIQDKLVSARS